MAEMHPARHAIGRFLALGLLAAHLVVISMAMSLSLHHWLHGDADEPDHHCAATAMIDGQFDRPETPRLAVSQPLLFAGLREFLEPARAWPKFFPASPGDRAPPLV